MKYVYRDFPHVFNAYSERAHLAAHCVRDQGKYFPYSEKLFGHRQRRTEVDDLERFARELGLDMKTFDQCLSERKYLDLIRSSRVKAEGKGVGDVPAFVINGRVLAGPHALYRFHEIIEGELEWQR